MGFSKYGGRFHLQPFVVRYDNKGWDWGQCARREGSAGGGIGRKWWLGSVKLGGGQARDVVEHLNREKFSQRYHVQ